MKEVLRELKSEIAAGKAVALATVVRTWRSAPRLPGASLLVTSNEEVVGSISGGCVEGAAFERGQEALRGVAPSVDVYGVSDDEAFAVGLTCGGILEVFTESISTASWPELPTIIERIEAQVPIAVVTIVAGGSRVGSHIAIGRDFVLGTLGSQRLDTAVRDDVLGMLEAGQTGFLKYGEDGERLLADIELFVSTFAPPAKMFVFGAIDFASSVARVGKFLGFHVTVCDARPLFTTAKRFPDADELIVDWPHRYFETQEIDNRTVVCVLTHDPKFDIPLLKLALRSSAAYIGAMGSRRTHEDRLDRLRAEGLTEIELSRLHSPIGLDLGARTPEETAISIAAEIVAHRWGGSAIPLRTSLGPIHPGAAR